MIHYKILLLCSIILPKFCCLRIKALRELVIVVRVSCKLKVVGLTDVKRVSQHQVTQAPQCISHGGVGSFALQPVCWQSALLLFGQVSISPLSCYGNTGFLIKVIFFLNRRMMFTFGSTMTFSIFSFYVILKPLKRRGT